MRQASNICSYTLAKRSRDARVLRRQTEEQPVLCEAEQQSVLSREMPKREPTTEELRRAQRERITEEHEAIPNSITPDEELQHRRRAEKSAYLERMLAARERSERERDRD